MINYSSTKPVLVSGVSGFLGMHCVLQLLDAGYRVRGTVRSLEREDSLRQTLAPYTDKLDNLELVAANLLHDEGWDAAAAGCDYVLHTASPFPQNKPKHEDDLIIPAREGTLRVLRAAAANGVQRVVLTSSVVAIMSGYPDKKRHFNENDWSKLDGDIAPYPKSKTLAEQAAWDFIENLPDGQTLELAVINPSYIMGPPLDTGVRTSNMVHLMLMRGESQGAARLGLNLVDVRDVAAAHLAAMTIPEAAGQRFFICSTQQMWFAEFAQILADHFGPQGYKITTRRLPSLMVRLIGLFDRTVRDNTSDLDKELTVDNSRIKAVLGW